MESQLFLRKSPEMLKVKPSTLHPVLNQKYHSFNEVGYFSFCPGRLLADFEPGLAADCAKCR
jgi:hypothetical protein